MKVKTLRYERLRSTGNYEHKKLAVEVELNADEDPNAAYELIKKYVDQQLDPTANSFLNDVRRAERIVADPDNHTPNQVREAESVITQYTIELAKAQLPFESPVKATQVGGARYDSNAC